MVTTYRKNKFQFVTDYGNKQERKFDENCD